MLRDLQFALRLWRKTPSVFLLAQRVAFFESLLEDIRTLPGVTTAGAITFLPLTGTAAATSFRAVDKPTPADGDAPVTDVRVIGGDYFAAMRIPLQRGRAVGVFVLLAVSLAAGLVPGRRAARVDPIVALRYE